MPEIFAQPWMQVLLSLVFSLICYLLGCTNGAIIFSKLFFGDDVRNHGSGNAGLTNFYRTYGPKYALLVVLVDMVKAALSLMLGAWVFTHLLPGGALLGRYWAALCCIVGHMYPVTEKFKGGKGVLSSGMVMMFLGWEVAVCIWGTFLILFFLFRYVSLGSVSGAVVFPIVTWLVHRDWRLMIFAVLISGLVIYAHRSNIKRLLTGTENKFKFHVNKDESK